MVQARPQPPELIIAHKLDDFARFRLLVDLNDVPPHPGNIISCNSNTTTVDLLAFLGRVEKFSQMQYFVIGVNDLVAAVREALLKWVSFFYIMASIS